MREQMTYCVIWTFQAILVTYIEELDSAESCLPGCHGTVHPKIYATSEEKLTLVNKGDHTVNQEKKPLLQEGS